MVHDREDVGPFGSEQLLDFGLRLDEVLVHFDKDAGEVAGAGARVQRDVVFGEYFGVHFQDVHFVIQVDEYLFVFMLGDFDFFVDFG